MNTGPREEDGPGQGLLAVSGRFCDCLDGRTMQAQIRQIAVAKGAQFCQGLDIDAAALGSQLDTLHKAGKKVGQGKSAAGAGYIGHLNSHFLGVAAGLTAWFCLPRFVGLKMGPMLHLHNRALPQCSYAALAWLAVTKLSWLTMRSPNF